MAGISGLNQNYFYGGQTTSSVGTLLSSLGTPTGVNAISGLVSDYRTIQTGSYGKLLKEYYAQQADNTKSSKTSLSSAKSATNQLKNSLSDTKSKMEALNKSAGALAATGEDSLFIKKEIRQDDGSTKMDYDKDSIYSAVSKFVNNYNDAVSSASSSSTSSIASGASSLKSTTDVISKRLGSFGISSDTFGKLSVDEKVFKASDMAKLETTIGGRNGYASSIAQTASRISGTTSNKLSSLTASTYSNSGGYSNADYSSLFNSYF